jgi:ATP-binding cassette, subfamily B, bacterial
MNWAANGKYAVLSMIGKIYESTVFPFLQVVSLAWLLNLLVQPGSGSSLKLIEIAVGYVAASVLKVSLTSFLDTKQAVLDNKLEAYIDMEITKKLASLDPATLENPEFQSLYSQIDGVKGSIQTQLSRFTAVLDGAFKTIMAAIVLVTAVPWFVAIILAFTIPSFVAMNIYREKTWPFFIEKRSILVRLTQYAKALLSVEGSSKEVAIFGTGKMLLKKISGRQKEYFVEFNQSVGAGMWGVIGARIVQLGAFLYVQFLNLEAVLKGTLPIGNFTLLFQQTLSLAMGCEEMLDQYSSMSMRTKYFDRYFEFMNWKKLIQSPENPAHIPEKPLPPVIEFKGVSFRYPGTERWILKDFSLTISSGEKLALVGENGAGKTTIIKLLLRFYDVTQGELLINGRDIRTLNLPDWHKLVGALFQDFIRYQFTFRENVLLNADNSDERKMKMAIEKSGAETFLKDLPKGYDQIMGKMFEGGIDLSGGQWQKLALARAFFRESPILILDEPTSAIDAKAEAEIFDRINTLEKDKTVIIISHRFSTVRNADRIVVLNEGKILENGTHKSLMKNQGLYAELFELQAKGYR